ncbi:MAG: hypothetical protein Q4G09_02675 [Clostridia bacterium]|nr:hypothetical protein [Clostridia bacterium]
MTNKDKILELYFMCKFKQIEIAEKLNITSSAVSQVLKKDARFNEEKETRKALNRKKHIEETKSIIKRQREKKKFEKSVDDLILKNMHRQAATELSKKSYLTNNNYLKWNKSAYRYNSKKNRFEFKENELGRSYDVPKIIKVEV